MSPVTSHYSNKLAVIPQFLYKKLMIKHTFAAEKPKSGTFFNIKFEFGDSDPQSFFNRDTKEITILIDKKNLNRRKLILLLRKIIFISKSTKVKKISLDVKALADLKIAEDANLGVLIGENFEMANFEFVKYKTPPKKGWNFVTDVVLYGEISEGLKKGLKKGQIIGLEVNKCRELANTSGADMTPQKLAEAAKKLASETKTKITVFGQKEIKKLKMGGILGVSRGSKESPRFIIVEYNGAPSGQPIVLIGKGVTFDTGGLNVKTGDSMNEMHMDMSGGAAVIHAIAAAAKLGIKKNIIGLIPAVENMPSGESYRPGDILKSMSGKTIEIGNTDAEGRVILADAITYAKKYNPKIVIDVATLTGAAIAALGFQASAIFSKDESVIKKCIESGESSGDYVWPLPLWDEYEEEVRGTFGDVVNSSKSRYGGAINGAMFLYQFAKDLKCPWLHIDIAPRMTSVEGENLTKGAAGAPVRLLIKILETF